MSSNYSRRGSYYRNNNNNNNNNNYSGGYGSNISRRMSQADPQTQLARKRIESIMAENTQKQVSVVLEGNLEEDPNDPTSRMFQGFIVPLNKVELGPKNYQRIGNVIQTLKAEVEITCVNGGFNYQFNPLLGEDNEVLVSLYQQYANEVRFSLIWDSQPSTPSTISSIFQSIGPSGQVNTVNSGVNPEQPMDSPLINSPFNPENRKRYLVLRDEHFVLGDPTPALAVNDNPTANRGSGSSPSYYYKKFSIDVMRELARKKITALNQRTFFDMNSNITSGQLIGVLYMLKPNLSYSMNSTVYYSDN